MSLSLSRCRFSYQSYDFFCFEGGTQARVSRITFGSIETFVCERESKFPSCFPNQDLDRAVRLLLSKSGDTNRFIREDAHAALMAVTQHVQPARAIVAIVTEGLRYDTFSITLLQGSFSEGFLPLPSQPQERGGPSGSGQTLGGHRGGPAGTGQVPQRSQGRDGADPSCSRPLHPRWKPGSQVRYSRPLTSLSPPTFLDAQLGSVRPDGGGEEEDHFHSFVVQLNCWIARKGNTRSN